MNGQAIIDDMPGVLAPTFANDNTSALQALIATGAAELILTSGVWICTQTLSLQPGQVIKGLGGGYNYDHRSKLVFKGTGSKSYNIPGAVSPATLSNPAAGAGYLGNSGTRGNSYKFLDLNASFSAAVRLDVGSRIEDLGIYPLLNGGLGYEGGYHEYLSDDWDVGVWADNADGWNMNRVSVQGYWRKSAFLASTRDNKVGQVGTPSCEAGHAEHCRFYGFRGVTYRTEEADIGWGFAGTDFVNCNIRSLSHRNGKLATDGSITPAPFAFPSACIEMHGYDGKMRGIQFFGCTIMGRDDVAMIADLAREIMFIGCYWESKSVKVTGDTTTYGPGFRMALTDRASVRILGGTRYAMSTLPKVPNDPGINSGSRYGSGAVGVNNAYYYCDDEYYLPPTNPQKFRGNVEGTVGGMGPTGPTGPAGPAGPQGPLGPDGDGNLVLEKYTGAQLGDKTSAANKVGKSYGKMVLDTSTGKVVRANASGATGTWKNVGTGATEYSPS